MKKKIIIFNKQSNIIIKLYLFFTTILCSCSSKIYDKNHEACVYAQGDTYLLNVTLNNDFKSVQHAIEKYNAPINTLNINEEGNSALHFAALHEDALILSYLIQKGGDIHLQNNKGNTPMHIALLHENVEAAQILLNHNAKTDIKNNRGNTPLHIAALLKNTPATQLLLKYHAEIDVKNNDGNTPLHMALLKENFNATKILLAHGAKTDIKNNNGSTANSIVKKKPNEFINAFIEHKYAKELPLLKAGNQDILNKILQNKNLKYKQKVYNYLKYNNYIVDKDQFLLE